MRVVIAPDSFKESMSAYEAALSIEKGLKQNQDIETLLCPLADGGEGTLETLVKSMNGYIEYYHVCGPLLNKIQAPIGYVNDTAIIECAKVCGLELLEENQKNPYYTSTYGLGELIKNALLHRVKKIMICLGGSATNDGGIGMLQALGVHFYDRNHQEVQPTMQGLFDIHTIDISELIDLSKIKIQGVCDVVNILCGQQGATYIFGPQKGVLEEEKEKIDHAMHHYALKTDTLFHHDFRHTPSSGAAGGLGYALKAYLNGELRAGFDIVSETCQLENKIKNSDIVIVGEGKIDRQTQFGKTPYGVLQIAKKYNKNVYAFAGKVEDVDILKSLGFDNVYQITPETIELSLALKRGKEFLEKCVNQHLEELVQ